MQITDEYKMRMLVYSVVILIVAIGGGLFYLIWQDNQAAINQSAVQVGANNKFSGITIDTSITSSTIFRDLEPVIVPPSITTSTPTGIPCDANTDTPSCEPDNLPCIAQNLTCDTVTCLCVGINVDEKAVKNAKRRKSNPFLAFKSSFDVVQSVPVANP